MICIVHLFTCICNGYRSFRVKYIDQKKKNTSVTKTHLPIVLDGKNASACIKVIDGMNGMLMLCILVQYRCTENRAVNGGLDCPYTRRLRPSVQTEKILKRFLLHCSTCKGESICTLAGLTSHLRPCQESSCQQPQMISCMIGKNVLIYRNIDMPVGAGCTVPTQYLCTLSHNESPET